MDFEEDIVDGPTPADAASAAPDTETVPESTRQLVTRIARRIKADKKHHEKAFKIMKRDMFIAMHGREETWSEKNYKANIAGRHVKQKTASLYAKNPKATARRADQLDFAIWDENPQTLMSAYELVQAANMIMQEHQAKLAALNTPIEEIGNVDPALLEATAQSVTMAPPDPLMGHNGGPTIEDPMMPPGFAEAQELIADFTQGMARRTEVAKIGKTLEILFAKALREQKPVDFKTAMKQLVRRACTTCVGYVELGFQREHGPRPEMTEKLADARTRLDHMRVLSERVEEGDIDDTEAEMAELEKSVAALESEPEIVIREGLVFDYPRSTKVIPDRLCKSLVGFIGARHVTVEYEYTTHEVREMFDVDMKQFTGYTPDGKSVGQVAGDFYDEDGDAAPASEDNKGLVRVWKHYDKASGLVYVLADGHYNFLREPASPDVFVEDFWPIYALTFNAVESETELFPPSDVGLLIDMLREHNRARQGKREHRDAARPRWAYAKGSLQEDDIEKIGTIKPFEAVPMNIDPQTELKKILQAFPVPGVDPNLYETAEFMADAQLVVGTQEAQLGGTSQSTATESAIAANSSATSDGSSVDDLDAFLTVLARASGQILLREMSEETVMKQVGPGAVWPHLSLAEIAEELYLEVEAGSSGKPNQAVEIRNWKEMLPFLIQMGSIKPEWLAKETLRRLDDRMDLTDAVAAGLPSIVAMNANAQPSTGDPLTDPNAQGPQGADKTSAPAEVGAGSGPAFGSNQV